MMTPDERLALQYLKDAVREYGAALDAIAQEEAEAIDALERERWNA